LAPISANFSACAIIKKVALRLEADRQSQQNILDAGGTSRFRSHTSMRHGRGMGHQAFDAAERLGKSEDADRFGEPLNALDATADFETEHGAETALLSLGNRVTRKGWKAWIVDDTHLWLSIEECSDRHSAPLLVLDPGKERAQPSQRLVGVKGRSRHPDNVGQGCEISGILSLGRYHNATDNAVGDACAFSLGIAGQVLTFRTRAWSRFAPPTCRMPLGPYQDIPRAHPGGSATPWF
jgi:hypothetical protein